MENVFLISKKEVNVMDSILNSLQALQILKQGLQIMCVSTKQRVLFTMQNEIIKAASGQASYRINQDDFLELFFHESFIIHNLQADDAEISKLKDEEYYAWKHK